MSSNSRPHVDEYPTLAYSSPHLTPRLLLEQPILPAYTLHVAQDGSQALVQRWYDVSAETLDCVDVRSRDFLPDGVLRLVDKDDREICRATVKLDSEWGGLPMLLARIEKAWETCSSFEELWQKASEIMFRTPVPTFTKIASDYYIVDRSLWMEFACFWMAFLAAARGSSGESGWENPPSGDNLLFKYVDFFNSRPDRGPRIDEPSFAVDQIKLAAQLVKVRSASTNREKKVSLETLAEMAFGGIDGFEVQSSIVSATGEIDRLVRNNCSNPQMVRLGPELLVECKHWSKAVGTDEIGAFIADLQDAKLTSGIVLSRREISRDGETRIFNYHQRVGGFVLPFSERDIERVRDGANLAAIILDKMKAITYQKRAKRKIKKSKRSTR